MTGKEVDRFLDIWWRKFVERKDERARRNNRRSLFVTSFHVEMKRSMEKWVAEERMSWEAEDEETKTFRKNARSMLVGLEGAGWGFNWGSASITEKVELWWARTWSGYVEGRQELVGSMMWTRVASAAGYKKCEQQLRTILEAEGERWERSKRREQFERQPLTTFLFWLFFPTMGNRRLGVGVETRS